MRFAPTKGGWILRQQPGDQCAIGLCLYPARWGPTIKFMLKIFVDGAFGRQKGMALDPKQPGDVFKGDRQQDLEVIDLESSMPDAVRICKLRELIESFIFPFADKARKIDGIVRLADEGEVHLLPAVKKEIEKFI